MELCINNQEKITEIFDARLQEDWKRIVVEYDLDYDERFPKILDKAELKMVYGISRIYVYEETRNNRCFVGFSGEAKYDQEHGIDFVLNNLVLVDYGESSISFDSDKVEPFKFE